MTTSKIPVITTSRLLLKEIDYNDQADLFEMRSNTLVHEYTDSIPDKNMIDTKKYIDRMLSEINDNGCFVYSLVLKTENKVIGIICLWNIDKDKCCGEVGYVLNPNYHHRGLMKEALLALINYAFTSLNLVYLDAYVNKNNNPSLDLLKTLNFKKISSISEAGTNTNDVYDLHIYRLNK